MQSTQQICNMEVGSLMLLRPPSGVLGWACSNSVAPAIPPDKFDHILQKPSAAGDVGMNAK